MIRTLLISLALLAGVALTVLPSTPAIRPLPGVDAGVFNYVAWRMLEGEVPYRDVWDHKPPLIFFIHVLGLVLGRGTTWGQSAIQFLADGLGLMIGFHLLRKPFGDAAAFVALLLGVFAMLVLVVPANCTEHYALPWGFLILALYRESVLNGSTAAKSLLMGLASAALFFTKQTLIGVPAAVCLSLFLILAARGRWAELARGIAFFLLGFAGLIAPIVAYFAVNGALSDFWQAAFGYNLAYGSTPPGDGLMAALKGFRLLHRSGLLYPALAGYFGALLILRLPAYRNRYADPLLVAALLGWPIEIWLSGLSGRAYHHYFLAWIPLTTVLAAFSLGYFFRGLPDAAGNPRLGASPALRTAGVLAFVSASGVQPALALSYMLFTFPQLDLIRNEQAALEFIVQNTKDDDPILLWGAESALHFASRRRSSSRFVYQWPLFEPYHPDPRVTEIFRNDLLERPPRIVIDTSETDILTPPLDARRYAEWLAGSGRPAPREGMRAIADDLFARYRYAGRIMNWHVYVEPGLEVRLPPLSLRDQRRLQYVTPPGPGLSAPPEPLGS